MRPYNVFGALRAGTHDRWTDVALVVLLAALSGNPGLMRLLGKETTWSAAAVVLGFAALCRCGARAFYAGALVAAIFAALMTVHAVAFDFFAPVSAAGFCVRLAIGMSVAFLVRDFARAYVTAMTLLAGLGLLFWLPQYLASRAGVSFYPVFGGIANVTGPQTKQAWSLVFHTYMLAPGQTHRNAGIFWEPGAFAGYLVLALILLPLLRTAITRTRYFGHLGVLVAAVLSTFSTTGYLALPLAMMLNYDWQGSSRKRLVRVCFGGCLILPLLVWISLEAFRRSQFLGPKIGRQLKSLQTREYGWQRSRFGSLVFDWTYIRERPLTGWGHHFQTRYARHPWMTDSRGMGNGMSDFIASFGLIGFGTFAVCAFNAARKLSGSFGYACAFIAAILTILQGEAFLNFPLFFALMFVGAAARASLPARSFRVQYGCARVQTCRSPLC